MENEKLLVCVVRSNEFLKSQYNNIMKKLLIIAALLVVFTTACAQGNKTKENKEMKTLVAYFSATGTTEKIAKKLANVTGADLYQIIPEERYTDEDLDWRNKKSRSSVEMMDKSSRPAFIKDLKNAQSYDVIYIGFPIWWYTAPTIINTFLDTYDFSGKTVIFFATSGSSGIDGADKQFQKQYPNINWKPGKILNGATEDDIKEWIENL